SQIFTNGFAIHPHATPLGAEPGAELPVPVRGSTISPVHSIICDFVLAVFSLCFPAHSGTLSARTIAGGRIIGNIEERVRCAQFTWRLGDCFASGLTDFSHLRSRPHSEAAAFRGNGKAHRRLRL